MDRSSPPPPQKSKLPLCVGVLGAHLTRGSLGPPESTSQTTSRSVFSCFCRAHDRDRATARETDRQTDHATVIVSRICISSRPTAMRPNNNNNNNCLKWFDKRPHRRRLAAAHGPWTVVPILYNGPSSSKLPLFMRASWLPSNTWIAGPPSPYFKWHLDRISRPCRAHDRHSPTKNGKRYVSAYHTATTDHATL